MFYGLVGNFMNIWYIFCSFGAVFPVLVACPKKKIWQPCSGPAASTFPLKCQQKLFAEQSKALLEDKVDGDRDSALPQAPFFR
jgi:hypothetical protein